MANIRKIQKVVAQFRKNHPQYVDAPLFYTVVPKDQFLTTRREGDKTNYVIGEVYDDIPTDDPMIYGPAILLKLHGKTVGIFPG